ncbi:MAG: hypothetical protein LBR23_05025 [Spirochaetaceae bacterium]|jgi:mannosyltransferase OCH1-like enzyme|nr:hypothetical protein [Spirochaetaceae bacterium]
MVPKKIHYCWLGGEKMTDDTMRCIESWKRVMPDYELVLWDKNRFDVDSVPFTQEAYRVKKWAFAADYIRLYAIYTEGGIYLDTDVYVRKSFNDLLKNDFFTAMEYHKSIIINDNAAELLHDDGTLKHPERDRIFAHGIGIQSAFLGGIKGHPFIKSCLDWYRDKHFILPDGSYYNRIVAPAIYADVMMGYGFRYKDELQKLHNGITVYPSSVFAGSIREVGKESYAVHCCHGNWREKSLISILKRTYKKFYVNWSLRWTAL